VTSLQQTYGDKAALVAAVVSAAFSWPTTAESPWTTKAAFYASLVLALSAIASASQQSTALYRYGKHPTGLEKLRKDLARPMEGAISSKLQTYTLRVPVMLLNISVILLLIGLIILIWNIAARAPAWDSDMKASLTMDTPYRETDQVQIAFVVRLAGVFALANHVIGTVAMSKWHHESNRYQSE